MQHSRTPQGRGRRRLPLPVLLLMLATAAGEVQPDCLAHEDPLLDCPAEAAHSTPPPRLEEAAWTVFGWSHTTPRQPPFKFGVAATPSNFVPKDSQDTLQAVAEKVLAMVHQRYGHRLSAEHDHPTVWNLVALTLGGLAVAAAAGYLLWCRCCRRRRTTAAAASPGAPRRDISPLVRTRRLTPVAASSRPQLPRPQWVREVIQAVDGIPEDLPEADIPLQQTPHNPTAPPPERPRRLQSTPA